MSWRYNPFTGNLDYTEDQEVSNKIGIAQGNVSALKAIYKNTIGYSHADKDLTYIESQVVGISLTAANDGGEFEYIQFGDIDDVSLAFSNGENIFLGNNGNITQLVPTTGHRVLIGTGLGTGKVKINIQETIIL